MEIFQKNKVVSAVRNFKDNPINNLGIIIPYLAVMAAMGGFLVAFILFIINGGYGNQINIIKSNGINGIGGAFTYGTISIMYGAIVGTIIKIFLGSELILTIIAFYKESSNAKRIIISIDLGLGVLATAAALISVNILYRKIALTREQEIKLLSIMNVENLKMFLIIFAAVGVATLITFLILILTAESKWMLGYGIVSGMISMVAIPLILLLIENIIPLIAGIVALAILGVILWFVFSSPGCKESSSNASNNHTVASYEKPQKESKKVGSNKNSEVVDRGFLGIKLWKVHGIMHDYVQRDNGIGEGEVCSLDDLRKGKFHIYDKSTGNEIIENEIPWKRQ